MKIRVFGFLAFLATSLLLILIATTTMSLAQDGYSIDWWALDSGGNAASGGDFDLGSSIGQPDSDAASGGDYELVGGYDSSSTEATDTPVAGVTASSDSPTMLGNATHFTATVSAGSNVRYAWYFGDGATESGATVSHVYTATGDYAATVIASNSISSLEAFSSVTVSPRWDKYLPIIIANAESH